MLGLAHVGIGQVVLLDRVYDFVQMKEFRKAEEALLKAEKHVTTANDPRTYYLKSFVYKELFANATNAERELFRAKSIENLQRCRSLDRDGTFTKTAKELDDFLVASIFNDGTEFYNNQNHKDAVPHFRSFVALYKKEDATWLDAHYYLGTSYYELKALDSAKWYLSYVKARNYDQPLLFADLSYIYFNLNQDSLALSTIADGVNRYPAFFDLQVAQLNILAGLSMYDTLESFVEKFLNTNSDNIEALLLAGTTYQKKRVGEQQGRYFLKAEKVYKHVLEVEPLNFDANYNLGVLYYNEAVDIVNKNDIDTNIDELTKVLEVSTKLFEQALPLLRSINSPDNDNLKLLQALQAIYYNLNMKEDLAAVTVLIKGLTKS